MKKALLFTAVLLSSQIIYAQTNPAPVSLPYPSAYAQNFDSFDGTSTTYPAGFQGGKVASATPSSSGRLTPATSDYALRAGGSAATATAGVWDYNGKIGFHSDAGADASFLLALNTSNVPVTEQINLKFDASLMRNLYDASTNSFVCGLAVMYRVGTTDNFTLLDNAFINNENEAQSIAGTVPVKTVSVSYNLPLACSGQSVIQIRWIMRAVSGTALSGGSNRPNYAIDNIIAQGISTLPVSLSSFSGQIENQGIKLNWKTSSEKNSAKFQILRAGNDKLFAEIGEINAKGNSDQLINYSFTDIKPNIGTNYYQLRQIDLDGAVTNSSIIAVNYNLKSKYFSIFYNSDNSQVQIDLKDLQNDASNFKIIDLQGRKVLEQTILGSKSGGILTIPFSADKGIYVGILKVGNQVFSEKFAVK